MAPSLRSDPRRGVQAAADDASCEGRGRGRDRRCHRRRGAADRAIAHGGRGGAADAPRGPRPGPRARSGRRSPRTARRASATAAIRCEPHGVAPGRLDRAAAYPAQPIDGTVTILARATGALALRSTRARCAPGRRPRGARRRSATVRPPRSPFATRRRRRRRLPDDADEADPGHAAPTRSSRPGRQRDGGPPARAASCPPTTTRATGRASPSASTCPPARRPSGGVQSRARARAARARRPPAPADGDRAVARGDELRRTPRGVRDGDHRPRPRRREA